MSDQTGNLQQAGPGQVQNASTQQGGEQPAGAQPQYITKEEALQIFKDQFGREGQRISDRTSARVQKVLDAARAQGMNITPQHAQAIAQALEEGQPPQQQQQQRQQNPPAPPQQQAPGQAPTQGQPGQLAQQPPPAYDPVTNKAVAILRDEFGLTDFNPENVDTEEPEFKMLDMQTTDPETFLASVRAYGKAKAEKKSREGDASVLPSLGSSGSKATTPAHANQRGHDVLESYYRNHST